MKPHQLLTHIALLIIIAGLLTHTLFTKRRTEAYENQIEQMKIQNEALNEELNNSYLLLRLDGGNVVKQLQTADFVQLRIIGVDK